MRPCSVRGRRRGRVGGRRGHYERIHLVLQRKQRPREKTRAKHCCCCCRLSFSQSHVGQPRSNKSDSSSAWLEFLTSLLFTQQSIERGRGEEIGLRSDLKVSRIVGVRCWSSLERNKTKTKKSKSPNFFRGRWSRMEKRKLRKRPCASYFQINRRGRRTKTKVAVR